MAELLLTVQSGRQDPAQLQELTREIRTTINRATPVRAELPAGREAPGSKGDAVTLGSLVLTFMTSGAAVALFQIFKAYFERDKTLVLKIGRADGQSFELNATNLSAGQVDRTMAMARDFLEPGS